MTRRVLAPSSSDSIGDFRKRGAVVDGERLAVRTMRLSAFQNVEDTVSWVSMFSRGECLEGHEDLDYLEGLKDLWDLEALEAPEALEALKDLEDLVSLKNLEVS